MTTPDRHPGMTRMTKLEVVLSRADIPALADLLTTAGATGWTSVDSVSGLGHSGLHTGNLAFNDRDTLSLVVTVVPDEAAEAALVGVRRLLDTRPGVVFASDTWVSRPDYFR